MNGKTTGNNYENDSSDSDIEGYQHSYSDLSSGSDDDQNKVNNKPGVKKGSKCDNMDFLVKSMLDMKESMIEIKDHNKRMEEKVSHLEEVIKKIDVEGRGNCRSVITLDARRSISDITAHTCNIDDYFKKQKKIIDEKIRFTIYQHTFSQTKFLYEPTRRDNDDPNERPPTPTEMVVKKAIEIKQISVPKEIDEDEFIRRCLTSVKQMYNVVCTRMQQNVRLRWIGEF